MISWGITSSRCFRNRPAHILRRALSSTPRIYAKAPVKKSPSEPHDKWNYNSTSFNEIPSGEQLELQLVDANMLENGTSPPRSVKMLARDFIEDSLYNPNYGYFPKQATIFNTQQSTVDYTTLRDSAEFQEEVGKKYAAYGADRHDGPGRQLWHTPTELFKVRTGSNVCLTRLTWVRLSRGMAEPLPNA